MTNTRRTPSQAPRASQLSEEQNRVLECLRAGLGRAATATSTGLAPGRVEQVVRDLIALRLIAPASASTSGEPAPAASPEATALERDSELPEGVEPWSGGDMPEGTTSSHGLRPRDDEPASSSDGRRSSLPPRTSRPPASEINYRHVYETRFRELAEGERADAARHVSGGELLALCLDPAPRVVGALMENAAFGLSHARAIALHHRSPQGLELLTRRAPLARDAHVQRRLLSNLQLPDVVLERLLRTRRLLDVYRLSVDRDLPERTRTRVRSRLRRCFNAAEPDERAAMIIKTEGRCLIGLTGCTFDGRTTQILCNQSFLSTLFIQNLARFPATPPALLSKLMRSAPVRRQPQLRAMLQRHANASGEWKRKG